MKSVYLWLLLAFPFVLSAQRESVSIQGMELSYALRSDSIDITLSAPTRGWVGIGFNKVNSIVGSDLILFHIVENKSEVLDMFVLSAGNPKPDHELGGSTAAVIKQASEKGNRTIIDFSIPLRSKDPNDFPLEPGKDFWLILAYSTHDEFDHHSRMRRHIQYRFDKK